MRMNDELKRPDVEKWKGSASAVLTENTTIHVTSFPSCQDNYISIERVKNA